MNNQRTCWPRRDSKYVGPKLHWIVHFCEIHNLAFCKVPLLRDICEVGNVQSSVLKLYWKDENKEKEAGSGTFFVIKNHE